MPEPEPAPEPESERTQEFVPAPGPAPEKPRKKHNIPLIVIIVLLVLVFLGCAAFLVCEALTGSASSLPEGGSDAPISIDPTPSLPDESAQNGALTPRQAYERVAPMIAAITSIPPQNGTFDEAAERRGVGILLNDSGYLLTNASLLQSLDNTYRVTLSDGTEWTAAFVAGDARTDLALLHIDAEKLTPAVFGNAESAQVGDPAYLIGLAGNSGKMTGLTVGYLSSVTDCITVSDGEDIPCLQTDRTPSGGDSAVLVNEFGQIIALYTTRATGVHDGGVFLPITYLQEYINELLVNGKITGRMTLGGSFVTVTAAHAIATGLPTGVYVESAAPGGGLATGGVKPGDVITACDGVILSDASQLQAIVRGKYVGQTLDLTLFRVGEGELSALVRVWEEPEALFPEGSSSAPESSSTPVTPIPPAPVSSSAPVPESSAAPEPSSSEPPAVG